MFLNLKTALDFSRTIFGRFPNPIILTEINRCVTRREKTKHNTHCDCTSHDMSVVRTLLFLGIITHGILATEEDKEVYRAIVEVFHIWTISVLVNNCTKTFWNRLFFLFFVLQSCGGWRLNRLPEVKRFIYEDLPLLYPCWNQNVGVGICRFAYTVLITRLGPIDRLGYNIPFGIYYPKWDINFNAKNKKNW